MVAYVVLLVMGSALPLQAGQIRTTGAPGSREAQKAAVDLTRKAPYLIYPDSVTQMEVHWQLTATATSTLEWGTDTNYGLGSAQTTEYGTDHQHAYTIDGLTPGTKYFYRVTTEGVAHTGSFTSAPPSGTQQLKFVAYGDTRSYPSVHDQVAGAIVSAYTADPGFQTLALVVGDLVYSGDLEADWTNQFFSPSYPNIQQLLADLPYHSCMGNHEGTGALFVKYFPYPFAGARYWSFDYGPAHFVVVDQYTAYGPGSLQLLWMASDLAAATAPWKFVILHEPGWSAGGGHSNNSTVQTAIQPLCEQYRVAIVFGGHNHYYARAVVNGVQHVTTGGGGAPLHVPNPSYPNVVAAAQAYHFCKVTIDAITLQFQAVNPSGAVLDSFSIQLPVAVEEPPVPATLATARPNPFSTETFIECRLAQGMRGRLVILDLAGRRVRSFPLLAHDRAIVEWDGTNDQGLSVPAGLYLYRLESSSGTSSAAGKLLRLR
jgi:hypothetical protein